MIACAIGARTFTLDIQVSLREQMSNFCLPIWLLIVGTLYTCIVFTLPLNIESPHQFMHCTQKREIGEEAKFREGGGEGEAQRLSFTVSRGSGLSANPQTWGFWTVAIILHMTASRERSALSSVACIVFYIKDQIVAPCGPVYYPYHISLLLLWLGPCCVNKSLDRSQFGSKWVRRSTCFNLSLFWLYDLPFNHIFYATWSKCCY